MKKIVLAATAVLALSGAAFAGSDNYGSAGASQQAPAVDTPALRRWAPTRRSISC